MCLCAAINVCQQWRAAAEQSNCGSAATRLLRHVALTPSLYCSHRPVRKVRPSWEVFTQTKASMLDITCKTLDGSGRFRLRLAGQETVQELLDEVEVRLGRENCYRLVSAGRIMHPGERVTSYTTAGLLPLVVMVTSPAEQERQAEQVTSVQCALAAQAALKRRRTELETHICAEPQRCTE